MAVAKIGARDAVKYKKYRAAIWQEILIIIILCSYYLAIQIMQLLWFLKSTQGLLAYFLTLKALFYIGFAYYNMIFGVHLNSVFRLLVIDWH